MDVYVCTQMKLVFLLFVVYKRHGVNLLLIVFIIIVIFRIIQVMKTGLLECDISCEC